MVELRTRAVLGQRSAIVAGIAAGAMASLGAYHAGDRGPGAFDASVARGVHEVLGGQPDLLQFLVLPTQPYVLLPVIALIALVSALHRDWTAAALAVGGPALAVAANTWLLKPLFERYNDGHLAYPSGHTVSLVSVLTVLTLLARPGLAKAVVPAFGTLLVLAAGTGMIGLGYHYATDVIGGVLFAVAAVLALAIVLRTRSPRREQAR
ncbi:phosphatase PAP2 family protein [Amycolatopsis anabasis]|uniref:phosphatase PAP2 family protein n=1 Tax=Amycolatopsis anabasis TaxID=1840409 RepID=UPI00131CB10B|nr:phosphatase PAP2 family protein [Amycolatopsis anabasis]